MSSKKKIYTPMPASFHPQLPPEEPEVNNDKFVPVSTIELDEKINKQLCDFSALVDKISTVEDKQKALWKQIYENAVQDRRNAYLMWSDLYAVVHSNPTEHSLHGQNLARYLERMSKANDQILKLAELVSTASEDQIDEVMNEEEMYEKINKMAGSLKQ